MIKKSLHLALCCMLIICMSFNQPIPDKKNMRGKSGVYLRGADYSKGKLAPFMEGNSAKHQLRLHRIIGKYIEVITSGKTFRYHKDSVFGYRNDKNEDYRFYTQAHDEYRIAEYQEIVIYILLRPVYGIKNFTMAPFYYFSITPESQIIPLSVINIKRAFSNSFRLQHYLDLEFDETTISAYDEDRHMYKINYFLNQVKQIENKTLK